MLASADSRCQSELRSESTPLSPPRGCKDGDPSLNSELALHAAVSVYTRDDSALPNDIVQSATLSKLALPHTFFHDETGSRSVIALVFCVCKCPCIARCKWFSSSGLPVQCCVPCDFPSRSRWPESGLYHQSRGALRRRASWHGYPHSECVQGLRRRMRFPWHLCGCEVAAGHQ